MPQSKKGGILYSVSDVIEAIQNGESDFEMDTEDESEEEDFDSPKMEKENQPPSDPPLDTSKTASPINTCHFAPQTVPRNRYRWQKKDFCTPNSDFLGQSISSDVICPNTPLEYFRRFVSEEMIQSLAQNTNEYSFQKRGVSINTCTTEIDQLIGMYLKMGIVQMPGVRVYWETDTRYAPVSDVMSRNKFQSLLASLHFVNNLLVSEEEKNDKVWKLRPWLEDFRRKCLQIKPEEHNSVDEMMIPFRGKFSGIKQYMRGKPNPWGFKLWVRTGISGILCDFDVYQGSLNGKRVKSELGLSGDVVMKLTSTLPKGQNYKVYADNYFTSIPPVSTLAGPEPVDKIQRWDKVNRKFVEVERPNIVGVYNKFMGGVDLLDSFAAKYKFPLKSRRWYIYIFWHTIILAVINAWLLYKRDCKALNVPKKDTLNRRQFQGQLASSLILQNTTSQPKRGRPPQSAESPLSTRKRQSSDNGSQVVKRSPGQPPKDISKDMYGHFPGKTTKGRCRQCTTGYTSFICSKCNVRLCLLEKKNCFWDYHH